MSLKLEQIGISVKLQCQTIFAIEGIASMPEDSTMLVERMRLRIGHGGQTPATLTALLTQRVDEQVTPSDRRAALAELMLSGGWPCAGDPDRLAEAIDLVRERRRGRHSENQVFLVTEVTRSIRPPRRAGAVGYLETEEFSVVFEGPVVEAIANLRDAARQVEMALIGTLRLDLNDDIQYQELNSSTYSIRNDGHVEYRLWLRAGSVGFKQPSNLTRRSALALSRTVRANLGMTDAAVPLELVGRASSIGQDETVEFLVAFTALEQHIKARIGNGTLRKRFETLRSQRGLPAADLQEFKKLYEARNDLAHQGELIHDRHLARRVRNLLARCRA